MEHGPNGCCVGRQAAIPSTCAALSCRHSGLSRRPALRSAGLHRTYSAARMLHVVTLLATVAAAAAPS